MTKPTDNSAESTSLEELLELVSARVDGELTEAEARKLVELESLRPDISGEFQQDIRRLGRRLRSIPVTVVAGSLFNPATVPVIHQPAELFRQNNARKLVVGLVTSFLCAGLLFSLVTIPREETRATLARAGRAQSVDPTPVATDAVTRDLIASTAGGPPEPLAVAEASESLELLYEPLVESDNWNIVVVKVDHLSRDAAMQRIESIVRDHGLQLKGPRSEEQSQWMGVVLTSAGSDRDKMLAEMETVGESYPENTDAYVARSTREEIIAAVRESLKYPTRSELHHGKVFVALPTDSADGERPEALAMLAKDNQNVGRAGRHRSVQNGLKSAGAAGGGAPAAGHAPPTAGVAAIPVTLVVFEFPDDTNAHRIDSSQRI